MSKHLTLGVDIGGTHVTAAVVDLEAQVLLPATIVREHLDASGSMPAVTSAWAGAMQAACGKCGTVVEKIGIAMPGPFDYENGIALMKGQGKYDALYGQDVIAVVAEKLQLPKASIRLLNDAACFLQGEVFGGAAKGYSRAIGLTLGTGLGTASYRDGLAADADLWKMPFNDSIAEEYLSSRWFVKRFYALTGRQEANVKAIVDLLSAEPRVLQLFQEFGANLAAFLVPFIREADPEVIVLGGNISKAYTLFAPALRAGLAQEQSLLPIKTATLGEEAALIGAASLWNGQAM
ncbi:ROK family protein [Pontibacter mangrovi]|uniref:ROK family protein n=1 Tax=Pontibacter mangrovi TaxID=2589816 RepID=A0A501W5R1_9BACT|nr:ROK family protein [Pontibacter mangrovi]TPE42157.1 ROK family protein [Pontibacter mangrovi]